MSHRAKSEQPDQIFFTHIALEDAGEYVCTAENLAGIVTATNVLNVHQSPVVLVTPDVANLQLTEGDELLLECSATGIPAPQVIWFDNVQSESPEQFEHQLRLAQHADKSRAVLHKYKVRKTDEGHFLCRATNEAGSEDKYVYVSVADKRGDVGEYTFFNVNT